ncbi:MAG: cyanophycinase [Bacteroidaceae bacterium]|nr:cyanophycinase [Bacteroidaceae bacterium]MBR6852879.1 cyanophycinase [Prevotella sp.]
MKKVIFTVLTALSTLTSFSQTPITIGKYTTQHGPEKGSLVIIGGGRHPELVTDSIVALAGGKDKAKIVIVTNASGVKNEARDKKAVDEFKKKTGVKNVSALYLQTIEEANDESKLKDLKEATGVFFSGGRQWHITDAYLNTKAHQYFNDVLARGGVIAGSSAGASVQGSFLWRGDTKGPHILIGDHTQGLGFLRYSTIDQHILARNRQSDLAEFISAANKLIPEGQTRFIGIGIDEGTAIVVHQDQFEVIGKSFVAVHGGHNNYGRSDDLFQVLKPGDKYDLEKGVRITKREY